VALERTASGPRELGVGILTIEARGHDWIGFFAGLCESRCYVTTQSTFVFPDNQLAVTAEPVSFQQPAGGCARLTLEWGRDPDHSFRVSLMDAGGSEPRLLHRRELPASLERHFLVLWARYAPGETGAVKFEEVGQ